MELPKTATVDGLLAAWAAEAPGDVIAVEHQGRRRSLTIGTLYGRAGPLAVGLVALGASPDRPVVAWLPNGLEWLEVVAAAARGGFPVVGLNTRYRSDELRHVVERSDAAVLLAVDELAGTPCADVIAAADIDPSVAVVVVGDRSAGWERLGRAVHDWGTVAGLGAGRTDRVARPDDLLIAFTTSGTTGRPKLAAHDQAGVARHALADAAAFDVRPGDRVLIDLPLCGTFGFSSLMQSIGGRARCLLGTHFDPVESARAIVAGGVTHCNATDDMLARILDTAIVRAGEHRWREGAFADFVNAGHAVAARAERDLGVRLTGVYGMSEVFALLARWPATMPVDRRHRAGGIPVDPDLHVRVTDPQTGAVLPAGADGELGFRGPQVLQRYLGDPAATAAAIGDDGWFRSGDLGRLTDDGGFEYLARLGDSLRLRGFLVDPAEIERRLETHPAVALAQVVGAERPGRGQVAVAFVRLVAAATDPGEATLRAHCAAGIADFKVPRRIVVVDDFPSVDGPNGRKIRKHDLRERAATLVAIGDPAGASERGDVA
ncbi:MAG: AMP-binding protein [Actinomycetota bacterium]|nr:AMP-binding protein [Actinomycetota bacterium]